MNFLKYLKKKGIATDILIIVLLVVGLAVFVMLYIMFSGQGRNLLGNLSSLSLSMGG